MTSISAHRFIENAVIMLLRFSFRWCYRPGFILFKRCVLGCLGKCCPERFERLHVMHDGFMCSEIAAVKEEHAAELESICAGACSRSAWRSGESDPQVNALQSRNRTLQDKIQQQSSVIVELMEEVERLAEVENAMSVCCNCGSSSSSSSVVALHKLPFTFPSKHTSAVIRPYLWGTTLQEGQSWE
jgi:hypothetical protein